MENVVGLFGTCGKSKWREEMAIPILEEEGVSYFNPVVEDWNEEARENEAHHMMHDYVIMLVITGETSGITSMAESGWMAFQSHLRHGQTLILVLEDMVEDPGSFVDATSINKTRDLIRKYAKKITSKKLDRPSIKICETVEEATRLAVNLFHVRQAP